MWQVRGITVQRSASVIAKTGPRLRSTAVGQRIARMPRVARTRARLAAGVSVLGFGLVLGGCGTGGVGSISPFSAVEVGRARVITAADGRSATVQLVTRPPTVCAIAYGPTTALGSIADDPNMGGTAVSHHTVVLTGLSPATTYRYRFTATDARGQVFQTPQLATFTTPRATGGLGADVAVGAKVVAVSSQWSAAYSGANAVDGKLSTAWATAGNGDHAFITIDLRKPLAIDGVAFITRAMSDGSAITRTYSVLVDGSKKYGPFPAGTPADPRVARVSFNARTLRYQVVSSTGGNTGALEVEAFSRG